MDHMVIPTFEEILCDFMPSSIVEDIPRNFTIFQPFQEISKTYKAFWGGFKGFHGILKVLKACIGFKGITKNFTGFL